MLIEWDNSHFLGGVKLVMSFFVEMLYGTNIECTWNNCAFGKSFPVNFVPTGCVLSR
jgi:hypothetical protein